MEVTRLGSGEDRRVPKLLLDYADAAWSMGLSERSLRNFVACGELVAIKIGGRTLFDPADLEDFKRAHRCQGAKEVPVDGAGPLP